MYALRSIVPLTCLKQTFLCPAWISDMHRPIGLAEGLNSQNLIDQNRL